MYLMLASAMRVREITEGALHFAHEVGQNAFQGGEDLSADRAT